MIDSALTPAQREGLKAQYGELASGSTSRLAVLEANMKYQQLSMTPEQQQLFEARGLGVEEVCRWMDVPPVLVHHANVTTWGSGIEQIVEGWYKLSVRPILVSIEQAVRKRVLTPRQRASMSAEFSLDALLRGSPKDRAEIAAKKVQNGLATRNEMRQLENDPPLPGGDVLTVQSNLLPIEKLGQTQHAASGGGGDDVAQ
jgi:HK97 family phage portal protein